jgi:hypothetical protein
MSAKGESPSGMNGHYSDRQTVTEPLPFSTARVLAFNILCVPADFGANRSGAASETIKKGRPSAEKPDALRFKLLFRLVLFSPQHKNARGVKL